MRTSTSKDVEKTLQDADIHKRWQDTFRNKENEQFFELAYDHITNVLNAPENATILDVGCGTGNHTIRLARRGFSVMAVDFADYVLETAKVNVEKAGLADQVKLQNENLLSLSFENETFDYIICWGVLMHIPDVEKATSELARVLKKGGKLVISEGNMNSLQASLIRRVKSRLKKENITITQTPAGVEHWAVTSSRKFLTRNANVDWLKERFVSNGGTLKSHVAGQFTELYTKAPYEWLRKGIHTFNNFWFKNIKSPNLAYGNIIIVEKG